MADEPAPEPTSRAVELSVCLELQLRAAADLSAATCWHKLVAEVPGRPGLPGTVAEGQQWLRLAGTEVRTPTEVLQLRLGPALIPAASAAIASVRLQLWTAIALGPAAAPGAGKWAAAGEPAEIQLHGPGASSLCTQQRAAVALPGTDVLVDSCAVLLPRSEVWAGVPTAPRDWHGFAVSSAAGWTADEAVDEAAASTIWQATIGKWLRASASASGEAQREYRRQLRELAMARGAPPAHRGMAWYLLGGGHAKATEAAVRAAAALASDVGSRSALWLCVQPTRVIVYTFSHVTVPRSVRRQRPAAAMLRGWLRPSSG